MKRTSIPLLAILLSVLVIGCKPSDEKIAAAVTTALSANPSLSAISSTVENGVVTLTGEVEDDALKTSAGNIASSIEGVKAVTNSLTVTPKGPSPEELKKAADDALVSKVTENFATYKIQGITATADDGVVTLTGEIKRANLQNALKAAMESGATKVENKLTIK